MEQLFEGEEGSAWSGKSWRSSFSFFLVRYCVSRVDVGVDIVRLRDSLGMELLFLRHNTIRLILNSLLVRKSGARKYLFGERIIVRLYLKIIHVSFETYRVDRSSKEFKYVGN